MKIGEKVKIKKFDQLPEHLQTAGYKGLAGYGAEIIDSLYSEAQQCQLYRVRLTGAKTIPAALLPADALDVLEPARYYHEIEYLSNVVVVRFMEERGGETTEISRGHGHLIHPGAYGIAQAASYAMRRAYEAFNSED